MTWLCVSSSRSVRASSAPIWRLKPTMSVNMMAASLRLSVCAVLLVSSRIEVIILPAPLGCQPTQQGKEGKEHLPSPQQGARAIPASDTKWRNPPMSGHVTVEQLEQQVAQLPLHEQLKLVARISERLSLVAQAIPVAGGGGKGVARPRRGGRGEHFGLCGI